MELENLMQYRYAVIVRLGCMQSPAVCGADINRLPGHNRNTNTLNCMTSL